RRSATTPTRQARVASMPQPKATRYASDGPTPSMTGPTTAAPAATPTDRAVDTQANPSVRRLAGTSASTMEKPVINVGEMAKPAMKTATNSSGMLPTNDSGSTATPSAAWPTKNRRRGLDFQCSAPATSPATKLPPANTARTGPD